MSVEEIATAVAALSEAERHRLYAELERQRAGEITVPKQDARSAHERAKNLIGPGSGLGDLSANPAYLEGFGEEVQS